LNARIDILPRNGFVRAIGERGPHVRDQGRFDAVDVVEQRDGARRVFTFRSIVRRVG
jgi:hypothetical protein